MKDEITKLRESLPEGTIAEKLTDDELKLLDSVYIDLIGLIDYIDYVSSHIFGMSPTKNPLKFVQVVADSRGWKKRQ